jgi:predicted enzyme related to lactoylglutathione lyase
MEPRPPASRLDAVLLASPNPEALAAFYQHGFELEPPKWHGEDHLGLNLSNTYLGFDRMKEPAPTSSGSISIRFKVLDIEATFTRLVRLGAKVKYAPTKEESPGEILAMVYDPDGNSVGLISADSPSPTP